MTVADRAKTSVETMKCHACGVVENIDLIDAKDDGTGNFTVMNCIQCYGPGWEPCISISAHPSVAPRLTPFYARYLQKSTLAEEAMIAQRALWTLQGENGLATV